MSGSGVFAEVESCLAYRQINQEYYSDPRGGVKTLPDVQSNSQTTSRIISRIPNDHGDPIPIPWDMFHLSSSQRPLLMGWPRATMLLWKFDRQHTFIINGK